MNRAYYVTNVEKKQRLKSFAVLSLGALGLTMSSSTEQITRRPTKDYSLNCKEQSKLTKKQNLLALVANHGSPVLISLVVSLCTPNPSITHPVTPHLINHTPLPVYMVATNPLPPAQTTLQLSAGTAEAHIASKREREISQCSKPKNLSKIAANKLKYYAQKYPNQANHSLKRVLFEMVEQFDDPSTPLSESDHPDPESPLTDIPSEVHPSPLEDMLNPGTIDPRCDERGIQDILHALSSSSIAHRESPSLKNALEDF